MLSLNPSANGTETFYYAGSYNGQRLASAIQKELINTIIYAIVAFQLLISMY